MILVAERKINRILKTFDSRYGRRLYFRNQTTIYTIWKENEQPGDT
jgi:hypothetical protein